MRGGPLIHTSDTYGTQEGISKTVYRRRAVHIEINR